ncbi:MAG: hypothetical protein ABUT20_17880 [Bacteroidota bacterium]
MMMIALAYITTLFAQKSPGVQAEKKPGIKNLYLSVESDKTVPGQKIISFKDDKEYDIRMTDDKITELIVDGKKIAETDFYKYDSVIKKLKEQIKKDEEMAESDMKQVKKDQEQAEKDELQAKKDNEEAIEQRKMAEEDRKQAEEDRQQAKKDTEQAEEDRKMAEEDRKQAISDRKQAEEDKVLVKSLVNDLINENIIKNERELSSLVLKEGNLIVNDNKQPESVYQKFKAKYLKNPRMEIKFFNSLGHHGLSIQSDDSNQ